MATYLATVQIGRYAQTKLATDPVPITLVAPPGLSPSRTEALRDHAELMEFFVKVFGPYPFSEYAVVVTADELEIPLEAQTLSVFGSNALGADWGSARLVSHELAHQWFGNSLTLHNWRDIWLHEGFACYAEWLWSEESGLRSADARADEHWTRLAKLPQDLLLADPGSEDMFDDRLYKRGALLLHALRRTIGDGAFFDALRGWTETNRHGNVSTQQFIEFVTDQTGEDLAGFFDDWLFKLPLPAMPPAG
jgi:aminopeptidase N